MPLNNVEAALFVAKTDHVTVALTGVANGMVPVQVVPEVFVKVMFGCATPLYA